MTFITGAASQEAVFVTSRSFSNLVFLKYVQSRTGENFVGDGGVFGYEGSADND
ncbi:MAG: hypothetical protein Q7K65_01990 [Candidatus Buchananbacteria bacterium]|nr:hypothetical protein [Candidatus Buchananbacteria bacterium]